MLHPKYRSDIDGLRAVAVLSVVAFHYFPSFVSGGFIGVDVFFVISGYLITTIILENLESNTFSFIDFYSRRIRRIFPSLILILIACYGFGWFALYASEYKQLGKHIAAGAGFVQNFSLWAESGYFDNSSDTKPLIHLWSLAIEEQFYIFWPLMLWIGYKKRMNTLLLITAVMIVSFAVNVFYIKSYPIATFYSPLSRFWELLVGATWAYIVSKEGKFAFVCSNKYSNLLSGIGFLLIVLAVAVLNKSNEFPGWWALLPTLGAVFLIAAGTNAWINEKILSNKLMIWFGLISYPLYLWHWPLISFGQIIFAGKLPTLYKPFLILTSIALAYLTYRYWEKLLRYKGNKTAIVLLFFMVLIGTQGWSAYVRGGLEFREKHILDLHGGRPPQTDNDCLKAFNTYSPTFCRLSNEISNLDTVLIGDSIAHNDYSGLAKKFADMGKSFAMVGWPGRQPLIKFPTDFNYDALESEQMNKLIRGLVDDKNIKTIFLTMNQPEITDLISSQLRSTVEFFRAGGKNVIFIYPAPHLSFDPIECVGMPPFRPVLNQACVQNVKDLSPQYFVGRDRLKKIMLELKIKTYDLYPEICNGDECQIKIDDGLLYRTNGYLTTRGSEKVFQNFNK